MYRSLLAGSATLLAALSLSACTSQTQKCNDGVCDIDLSGVGSTVELGGDGGSDLELVSASGKTAKVKLDGKEGQLTVGQLVPLRGGTLELVEVEGENEIQLRVKGSSGDGAPATGADAK
ncbi:MAG: hypothetical protein Q7T55_04700 [Solirubrobacteraceae bacterium]|nr:hypothetical protein [Solirubrobacteraceae bacterium]